MSRPLLVWSQDDILAHRSGYHVLAEYLQLPTLVTQRCDPANSFDLLLTRITRRLSFSRYMTGGSLQLEKDLSRLIRKGQADSVHFLWCDRDLALLDRNAWFRKRLVVGTFHHCQDELARIIRRPTSLKHFAAIIIMSETQRAWFEAQGVQVSNIHRILHGVDIDYFRPAPAKASEHFTALAVGGTRRDFALLSQVASAMRSNTQVRFEIVGPHNKKAAFQGLPNVSYHDRLSDGELLAKYQQASCLLHLIEDSTANNVINEALACGTPVISQRLGGVPEYVTSDCALLCPPQDGASVVQAITRLAASSQQQQDMGLAARTHALTLDWRIVAEETRQLYASLC